MEPDRLLTTTLQNIHFAEMIHKRLAGSYSGKLLILHAARIISRAGLTSRYGNKPRTTFKDDQFAR